MTDENVFEPINVLLSREELLLVLSLLEAESIPGLDTDPLGELNEDQRTLAMIWAGRALRARELAQVSDDGALAVHSALLTAVGVCAYSSNTIFIYHWPEIGETPTRYFGHIRGDDIVAHTRPEDVLHLFTLLPSKEQLLAQILAVCQYEDVPGPRSLELTVTEEDFVRARELTYKGDAQAAVGLLVNGGVAAETAQAFVNTLANSPRVSILQTLKQEGNESVQKRDFTIVQNGQHAWFIAPRPGEDDNLRLLVKSTTQDEIEALLAEWL